MRDFLGKGIILALVSAAVCSTPAQAQILAPIIVPPQLPKPSPPPPDLMPGGATATAGTPQVVRWTENWMPAAKGDHQTSITEKLRYIPLGQPDIYLSLGGEMRYYYNDFEHASLGLRSGDNNTLTQERIRLVADLHVTPVLRAFVEIGHNREMGAERATPPNRGDWDFEQAFVDIKLPISTSLSLTLRPGRFEMPLGSGKLAGIREGVNRRYLYQGIQAVLRSKGRFALDVFSTRPLVDQPGAWDDNPDHARFFRGAYLATGRSVFIPDTAVDAYFYDVGRSNARYVSITGNEHRRSLGLRVYGRKDHWDYDLEGVYQFGEVVGLVRSATISAWGVLFEAGYSVPSLPLPLRFGIRANAFSGGHSANGDQLHTFSAPALKGPLFSNGDAAWFNESNIVDFFPTITLRPTRTVQLVVGPDFVWRQASNDGIYAVPTFAPMATPVGGRFVAATYNLNVDWSATRNLAFRLFLDRLLPGDTMRANGAKSSTFLGLQANLRL